MPILSFLLLFIYFVTTCCPLIDFVLADSQFFLDPSKISEVDWWPNNTPGYPRELVLKVKIWKVLLNGDSGLSKEPCPHG